MFQIIIFSGFGAILYKLGFTNIIIPFFKVSINLGVFYPIIVVILGLFFTNCTNLADGLDGLECFITLPTSTALGVILLLISLSSEFSFVRNLNLLILELLLQCFLQVQLCFLEE